MQWRRLAQGRYCLSARFLAMHKFPSTRRAPRGRTQDYRTARLQVETLESRLAPAVVGIDAAANAHAIDPNIYGTAFATTAQLADLNIPLNRNGGNASDTYSYAAGRHQPRQRLVLREHRLSAPAMARAWTRGSATPRPAARSRASRSICSTGRPRSAANRSILGSFPVSHVRRAAVDRPVRRRLGQRRPHQRHRTSPATTPTTPTSPTARPSSRPGSST